MVCNKKRLAGLVGLQRLFWASVLCFMAMPALAIPVQIGQALSSSPDGLESNIDDLGAGVESAESFSVATAFDLQQISWWGAYDPGQVDDDFVVRIFGDDSGSPDNNSVIYEAFNIAPLRTLAGVTDQAGADVYRYDYSLPALDIFSLAADDYWLSVVNVSLAAGVDTNWFWSQGLSGDSGNAFREPDLSSDWVLDQSVDLAFRIEGTRPGGTVSLPPTWLLLAMPALLVALRRRC